MKLKYIYLLSVILFFLTSCEKEGEITATEGLEPFYTLPQGNHDFDDRIMKLNEKYGIYPLYLFEDKDIYWNYSTWSEFKEHDDGNLYGKPSKPEYVDKQLDLLDEYFFAHYNSALLKFLPPKLLLCSELSHVKLDYIFYDDGSWGVGPVYTPVWTDKRYAQIAVNGGSEKIDVMTINEKVKFAVALATDFATRLNEINVLTPPDEFFEVARPHYVYTKTLEGFELLKLGLLRFDIVIGSTNEARSLKRDFDSYVLLVFGNTLAKLNGPRDTYFSDARYPTFGGVFNPETDVNGLVQRKYNIVVKYLKEMGVDVDFYQEPIK